MHAHCALLTQHPHRQEGLVCSFITHRLGSTSICRLSERALRTPQTLSSHRGSCFHFDWRISIGKKRSSFYIVLCVLVVHVTPFAGAPLLPTWKGVCCTSSVSLQRCCFMDSLCWCFYGMIKDGYVLTVGFEGLQAIFLLLYWIQLELLSVYIWKSSLLCMCSCMGLSLLLLSL